MTRQLLVLSACLICASPASRSRIHRVGTVAPPTTAAGPVVAPAEKPSPAEKPMTALESRIVADDRDYKIGPEDVLDISVWKAPELSRTVPVRPDGKVSLPLINDIDAAGMTPSVLRQELAKRLAEYVPSPEVAVIVREVHSSKVSVMAWSAIPAARIEEPRPCRVDALAQGFTDFANRDARIRASRRAARQRCRSTTARWLTDLTRSILRPTRRHHRRPVTEPIMSDDCMSAAEEPFILRAPILAMRPPAFAVFAAIVAASVMIARYPPDYRADAKVLVERQPPESWCGRPSWRAREPARDQAGSAEPRSRGRPAERFNLSRTAGARRRRHRDRVRHDIQVELTGPERSATGPCRSTCRSPSPPRHGRGSDQRDCRVLHRAERPDALGRSGCDEVPRNRSRTPSCNSTRTSDDRRHTSAHASCRRKST